MTALCETLSDTLHTTRRPIIVCQTNRCGLRGTDNTIYPYLFQFHSFRAKSFNSIKTAYANVETEQLLLLLKFKKGIKTFDRGMFLCVFHNAPNVCSG